MNKRLVFASVFVLVLTISTIGAIIYFSGRTSTQLTPPPQTAPYVADFESCAAAGYPVQESYPRRCSTSDGRSFTEIIDLPMGGSIKTLSQESQGLKKAQELVITSQSSYEKLWSEMMENSGRIDLTRPDVDFKKQVVIGVFAGPKGSGGHSIKIQSVTPINNGGKYWVQVEETKPGDSCTSTLAMTYPYHLVAYAFDRPSSASAPPTEWAPPSAKDFKFVTTTRVNNCYAD